MFNKLFKLILIQFKNNSLISEKVNFRDIPKKLIILMFVILSISISIILIIMAQGMYNKFLKVGLENLLIFIVLFIVIILSILISLSDILGTIIFSKDTKYLLTLPIHHRTILVSKFILVLGRVALISTVILLPFFLIHGVIKNEDIIFYLNALLSLCVIPIYSVLLVSIIMIVLMKFLNLFKFERLIKYIAYIFTAFTGVLLIYLIKFIDIDFIISILKNSTSIDGVFKYLPNVLIYKSMILESSILSYIYCILQIIILFITFIILGNKFYIEIIQSRLNTIKKKTKLIKMKNNNQIKSLLIIYTRIILRNPEFLTNCVIRIILVPISFLGILLINMKDSSMIKSIVILNETNSLNNKSIYIILSIIFIISRLNFTAITSISRMGKSILAIKKLPIPYWKQISPMIILAIIVNSIPILSIICCINIIFNIPLNMNLVIIFNSIFMIVYGALRGISNDILNSKIDYVKEIDVIKYNSNIFNMFIQMIIELIILVYIMINYKLNIIYLIFILANIIYIYLLNTKYKKIYTYAGVENNV